MKIIDKLITKEEELIQPSGSLVIEEVSQDAHLLGRAIQLEEICPEMDWYNMSIEVEIQKVKGNADLYNCVNNSNTNVLEFVDKKRTGKELNFSEMYSAVDSGTQPGKGNSFERVFEKTRTNFVAWEDEFPTMRDKTVEENYRKISDGLKKRVKERGKDYEVRYQFLGSQQDAYAYEQALKISPVTVAVEGRYIWKNGVVVNAGGSYNHAVVYLGMKDGKKIVFDSESKQVVPFHKDYKFMFPAVHSIKRINMIKTYKKHNDPTICVKVEGEDSMMAFANGDIAGGKLFKSIYGVEYKEVPRTYVDDWQYPIDYWIYAESKKQGQGLEVVEEKKMTFLEKLIYLFTK